MGGKDYDSEFQTIDIDPSGNIVAGGYTQSETVRKISGLGGLSISKQQPVIHYIMHGNYVLWSKYIPENTYDTDDTEETIFFANYTKILALISDQQTNDFFMLILSSSNGTILSQYYLNTNGYLYSTGSTIFNSLESKLYLGLNSNGYGAVFQFNYPLSSSASTTNTLSYKYVQTSNVNSIIGQIKLDKTEQVLFIGSSILYSGAQLVFFTNLNATTMDTNYHFYNYSQLDYPWTRLSVIQPTTDQYVYGCRGNTKYVQYLQIQLPSNLASVPTSYQVLRPNIVTQQQFYCAQIQGLSDISAIAIVQGASSPYIYLHTIYFSNKTVKQYSFDSRFSYIGLDLYFGKFINESEIGYFIGSLDELMIGTVKKPYTKYVGYIMSTDSVQTSSCLTLTYTQTSLTATNDTGFLYNPGQFSTLSLTILPKTEFTVSDTAYYLIDNSFCPIQTTATILSPTISNVWYDLGDGYVQFQVPEFTIAGTCNDTEFMYSVTSNKTTWPSFITFTSTNRTFSISTTTTSNVGYYLVTVNATLSNGQYATKSFVLNVTNIPCKSRTILTMASSPSNITYYINQGTLSTNLPKITASDTTCSPTITLTNSVGTAIDSALFTFTSTTAVLTTSSTNTAKINVYTLNYTGYIGYNNFTLISQFTVTVLHECANSVISCLNNQSTLSYKLADPQAYTNSFNIKQSKSTCPALTVSTIDMATGLAPISNVFTLVESPASSYKITVYTQENSFVGTYNIQATITNGYTTNYLFVTIYVKNACAFTEITSYGFVDQNYALDGSTINIAFTPWTESIGTCGSFSYSATFANGTSLPINLIKFQSSNREFRISSSNQYFAISSPYKINIIGSLSGGATETVQWLLNLSSYCTGAQLTTSYSFSNILYKIESTRERVLIQQFSSDQSITTCGYLSYQTTWSPDPLSTTPISVSGSNLNIYTNDYSFLGQIYTVTITVNQGGFVYNSVSFEVKLDYDCNKGNITATNQVENYYINDYTTFYLGGMVASNSSCGEIEYKLYNMYYNQYFNFTRSYGNFTTYPNGTTQIYVNDTSYAGNHTWYITGYQKNTQLFANQTTILVIQVKCLTTQIYSTSISSIKYDIGTGIQVTLTQLNWTQNDNSSNCAAINYTLVNKNDGSTADSQIFNISDGKLYIQTQNKSKVGTYQLQLQGVSNGITVVQNFTVDIQNYTEICLNTVISTSSIDDKHYTIGNPQIQFGITQFMESNTGLCGNFTYQSTFTNGTILNPLLITFDFITQKFTIKATDIDFVSSSPYSISLYGILPNGVQKYTKFRLYLVNPCFSAILQAPTIQPVYYTIGASSATTIVIPSFASNVPNSLCGEWILMISDQNGNTLNGAIFSADTLNSKITIQATSEDQANSSPYVVKIKGYQSKNPSLQVSTSFNVYIQIQETQYNSDQNNTSTPNKTSTNNSTSSTASKEEINIFLAEFWDSTDVDVNLITMLKQSKTKLDAKISSIDSTGVVTITFTDTLLTPKVIDNIRKNKAMITSVKFIEVPENNERLLQKQIDINTYSTWSVLSFKDSTITLQMNFTDPSYLSISSVINPFALTKIERI